MYMKVEERDDKKFITVNSDEYQIYWTGDKALANECAEYTSHMVATTHDLNAGEQEVCKQMILGILK